MAALTEISSHPQMASRLAVVPTLDLPIAWLEVRWHCTLAVALDLDDRGVDHRTFHVRLVRAVRDRPNSDIGSSVAWSQSKACCRRWRRSGFGRHSLVRSLPFHSGRTIFDTAPQFGNEPAQLAFDSEACRRPLNLGRFRRGDNERSLGEPLCDQFFWCSWVYRSQSSFFSRFAPTISEQIWSAQWYVIRLI